MNKIISAWKRYVAKKNREKREEERADLIKTLHDLITDKGTNTVEARISLFEDLRHVFESELKSIQRRSEKNIEYIKKFNNK